MRQLPARLLLAALLALSLAGCAPFDYTEPDAPVARAQPAAVTPPPRVALVLGSGGPRGYAHIGVLQALEEAGIQWDVVAGSSVGALVGAFWASGMSAAEIDTLARDAGPTDLIDPWPWADRGWVRGQRLQDFVNLQVGDRPLEQLPRPLVVVATRRDSNSAVFFQRGNAGVAVRASAAVPGTFSPVAIRGVEYEDADESLPLAVQAARATGAAFVIAVDVSAHAASAPVDASPEMLASDAQRQRRIDPELASADFVIHPDLGYWAGGRRSYFDRVQRMAYEATQRQVPLLRQRLAERGLDLPRQR